jgi:hypothetical protein
MVGYAHRIPGTGSEFNLASRPVGVTGKTCRPAPGCTLALLNVRFLCLYRIG